MVLENRPLHLIVGRFTRLLQSHSTVAWPDFTGTVALEVGRTLRSVLRYSWKLDGLYGTVKFREGFHFFPQKFHPKC